MSDTANDLIMQQGGTSDLDRAKRVINKQQAEIERLREDLAWWQRAIVQWDETQMVMGRHRTCDCPICNKLHEAANRAKKDDL